MYSARNGPLKISIEGNIAAGKSTFLQLVSKYTDLKTFQEPVCDWTHVPLEAECDPKAHSNLLENFYLNPSRWGLTFQQFVIFSRVKGFYEDKENIGHGSFLTERSVWGDRLVFARNLYKQGVISDLEYSLYCHQHSFSLERCPDACPDAILYLKTSPEICLERLQLRGRSEETSVTLEYLQQIHDRHEEWLIQKSVNIPPSLSKVPVLVVDCSKNLIKDDVYREEVFEKLKSFTKSLQNHEQ